MSQSVSYRIALHGGATGDPRGWTAEYQEQRIVGLGKALDIGRQLLADNGSAVDVVEQVVGVLEDDALFNAGRGCMLNASGEHELDASIMDGSNLQCGAVAGIKTARNPVRLARQVMQQSKHVLLLGSEADAFGVSVGVRQAGPEWFRTERRLASWRRWKQGEQAAELHRPKSAGSGGDELYLGTVGCVVLDTFGNLASATSTGGLMGKRWGRVGDSPIIGAGNYADQRCAVSGTGVGEEFMRLCICKDISARMHYGGAGLATASRAAVESLPADSGGVIAVDLAGNIAMPFNTPGMSRAWADSSGTRSVMLGRED